MRDIGLAAAVLLTFACGRFLMDRLHAWLESDPFRDEAG